MRSIVSPALALVFGLCFAISSASAQQVTSQGAIFGQNWNLGQDLESMNTMGRVNSPLARDRAARVARQGQFNRHYSGSAIRRTSTQAR